MTMQTHLLRQWLRLAVAAVAVFCAACGDSDGDAATARVEACELERAAIVGGQTATTPTPPRRPPPPLVPSFPGKGIVPPAGGQ